jgi:hypothetical protein
VNGTPDAPLTSLPFAALSPGSQGLAKILSRYRCTGGGGLLARISHRPVDFR